MYDEGNLIYHIAGSFHLLHLMFDDYVLYLVESLHGQERARELLQAITGEQTGTERSPY